MFFEDLKSGLKDSIDYSKGDLDLKTTTISSKIKVLLCDLDGVLTNGCYYRFAQSDDIFKCFYTRDFYGFHLLHEKNIVIGVISTAGLPLTKKQFDSGAPFVELYCGVKDKKQLVEDVFIKQRGYQWSELSFIADDVFDIPLLLSVGLAACPSDAEDEVIELVQDRTDGIVMTKKGGRGCVREFCNLLCKMV